METEAPHLVPTAAATGHLHSNAALVELGLLCVVKEMIAMFIWAV